MVHDTYHTPVLQQEVLDYLLVTDNKKYIDATLGGGGHTTSLLQKGALVLGIDVDDDAITHVSETLLEDTSLSSHLTLKKGNFRNIDTLAQDTGFDEVDGILFDFGVSSHQLDTGGRGFSIQHDGPLDMRMDSSLSVKAYDLVNGLTRQELADLFTRFGEEGYARQIANAISEYRKEKPIETTHELATLIESVTHKGGSDTHPATKVFQGLRIIVNDELHSIEEALPKSLTLLKDKGRIVAISFHSLEDRIVKQTFNKFAEEGKGTILTDKPIIPSDGEQRKNRRSRSSKMRVFEKTL